MSAFFLLCETQFLKDCVVSIGLLLYLLTIGLTR